jgi:hypothetical protein
MQDQKLLDNIRNALAPSSKKFQSSRKRRMERSQNVEQRNGPPVKGDDSKIKRGKTKQNVKEEIFFREIEESDDSIFHFDDDSDELGLMSDTKSPIHLNFEKFE